MCCPSVGSCMTDETRSAMQSDTHRITAARDAIIRVYRTCLLRISSQSHILSRPACGVGVCLARFYIQLYLRRLGIGSIGIHPHNDGVLTCRQVAAVLSAFGEGSCVLAID